MIGRGSAMFAGLCAVGLAGACEAIVPGDVPAVPCVPAPGACPTGQTCQASTQTCVAVDGGGGTSSGSVSNDATPPPAGCSTLGCKCGGPQDCASGNCANGQSVPKAFAAAQMTSFCTQPCCTSADCDAKTVCFDTAAGGSYCVLPEWLGRSPDLGTQQGGAPCEADTNCRSGLCDHGACADVCCSTAQSANECAGGTACTFGSFPGRGADKAYVPFCGVPAGNAPSGSACSPSANTCLGGLCAPDNHCHDACRSTADCGNPAFECGWGIPNVGTGINELISACETTYGTAAHGALGDHCTNNNLCQSGFCDASSMRCTDVCYSDLDCPVTGWRCRPQVDVVFTNVTFSVLACGS